MGVDHNGQVLIGLPKSGELIETLKDEYGDEFSECLERWGWREAVGKTRFDSAVVSSVEDGPEFIGIRVSDSGSYSYQEDRINHFIFDIKEAEAEFKQVFDKQPKVITLVWQW